MFGTMRIEEYSMGCSTAVARPDPVPPEREQTLSLHQAERCRPRGLPGSGRFAGYQNGPTAWRVQTQCAGSMWNIVCCEMYRKILVDIPSRVHTYVLRYKWV